MMMASSSSLPATSVPDAAAAAAAARQVVRMAMWTEDEDRVLREQVRRHGPQNWDAICLELPGRNSKSCRLRWCQHLDPRVETTRPFTPEEDRLIVKYQATHGNRWSTIAGFLSGRTDNAVKNRWNSVLRKQHNAAHAPAPDQRLGSFRRPTRRGDARHPPAVSSGKRGCQDGRGKLFSLARGRRVGG